MIFERLTARRIAKKCCPPRTGARFKSTLRPVTAVRFRVAQLNDEYFKQNVEKMNTFSEYKILFRKIKREVAAVLL